MDSFSTDSTVDIARARQLRVYQRRWDHFAGQRNWALDSVAFKHPWVFHLDADERFTDQLRDECTAAAKRDECSAYLVPSKMIFMGRWLKHAGMYPSYQMRFAKVGEARFEMAGHGQRESGLLRGLGKMKSSYLHYAFNKGIEDWFAKHNRYSTAEAAESLKSISDGRLDIGGLFSFADPVRRRRAMKELSFRLPMRPTLRFLYMYALRGGFLDGSPGYHYCRMISYYEYMIVLKMKEQRRREKGLPI